MSGVKISVEGKVVLISGANRGIGRALAVEALNHGAKKVYAGARNTETLTSLAEEFGDRLVPVSLDVTNEDSVKNVAQTAGDVEILINNAGVLAGGGFAAPAALESLQNHLDVNVFGLVRLTSAFIEIIKAKDSGAIVNVSSAAGLANMPSIGTYSSTKAMVHSITQGLRGELAKENILVAGVYPGPIETDMAKGFEMEKDSPENVAKNTYDGLSNGVEDIFPDSMSVQVGAGYAQNPKSIEKEFGAYVG